MQALNIHVEQIATAAIQNREQFGSLQGSEECNQSESSFYKKLQEAMNNDENASAHTKDTVSNTNNSQQTLDEAFVYSSDVKEQALVEEKLLKFLMKDVSLLNADSSDLNAEISLKENFSLGEEVPLVPVAEDNVEGVLQEILSQDDSSLAKTEKVKDLFQFLKKTEIKNNASLEETEELAVDFLVKEAVDLTSDTAAAEVLPLVANSSEKILYDQPIEITVEQNGISEIKNSDKKKTLEEIISVVDERSHNETALETEKGQLVTSVRYDEQNGTAEMTMNFTAKENFGENGAVHEGMKQQNASQFQSLLSQELQNNAGEFVRAGQIILKDNNKGTINLVLHPEELGNVKIQLELSDKVITGKIVVASEEAYQAFKSNLNDLRNAFTMNGFDNVSFDLSWTGEGSKNNQNNSEQQQFFAKATAEQIFTSRDSYEVGSSYVEYNDYTAISIIA